MKRIFPPLAFLCAILFSTPAFAGEKHITTLGAAAAVIVNIGANATVCNIQNSGANDVRLSLDGGAAFVDPTVPGSTYGTNPTAALGYLLKAGTSLTISLTKYTTGAIGLHRPIVAIMVSGSTTLEVSTDDTGSTFPTS
jgi:hypothetical protein